MDHDIERELILSAKRDRNAGMDQDLIRELFVPVRRYPDGSTQSKWVLDEKRTISVTMNRDNSWQAWVIYLQLGANMPDINDPYEHRVFRKDIYLDYKPFYLVLLSACVKAANFPNTEPITRMCVGARDDWMRHVPINDLRESNGYYDTTIQIVAPNEPCGVIRILPQEEFVSEDAICSKKRAAKILDRLITDSMSSEI